MHMPGLFYLVCVPRRNDVRLYGLREVFAVPHGLAKLPEQLSSDLRRHDLVWTDEQRHIQMHGTAITFFKPVHLQLDFKSNDSLRTGSYTPRR